MLHTLRFRQRLRLLLIVVVTMSLANLSGCAGSAEQVQSAYNSPVPSPISDATLRAYNNVASQALSQMHLASRNDWRKSRHATIMNAVVSHDARSADFFSSDIRNVLGLARGASIDMSAPQTAKQRTAIVDLFRRLGLAVNVRYFQRHGDFLWRLGPKYNLSPASVAVIDKMYNGFSYSVPSLETVVTESRKANRTLADTAFLAPLSLEKLALEREVDAQSFIESVALHEVAHNINNQLFDGDPPRRYNAYFNNLPTLTEKAALTTFYRHREVEEFLADAVSMQLGSVAVRKVATRVIRGHDILLLDDTYQPPRRYTPHDASAEFMYRLLLLEEQRLATPPPKKQTIEWLRSRRNESANWMKRHWFPYLDRLLTDDVVERLQLRYKMVFSRNPEYFGRDW